MLSPRARHRLLALSACHFIVLHQESLHVKLERKLINKSNKRALGHLSCRLQRQWTVATGYNEVQITNCNEHSTRRGASNSIDGKFLAFYTRCMSVTMYTESHCFPLFAASQIQSTPYPISVGSTLIVSCRLPGGSFPSSLPINTLSAHIFLSRPDPPHSSCDQPDNYVMRSGATRVIQQCPHVFHHSSCAQFMWGLWLT